MSQPFLVFLINRAEDPFLMFLCDLVCIFCRCFQFILGRGDGIQKSSFTEFFCIDIQIFTDIFHQNLLVVRIIDGEAAVIAEPVNMAPQDTHTGGVEGTDPDILCAVGDNPVHALPHFLCRFVGKGQSQDIVGIDLVFFDQVGDSVCQHSCLAGTGTGQNKQRSLKMKSRFPLFII